jgi:hypothetical protein
MTRLRIAEICSDLRVTLSVGVVLIMCVVLAVGAVSCGDRRDDPNSGNPSDVSSAFPLQVESGKKYLVDAAGRPFLIHGDTAWSLIADLSIPDAELYLEDRRRKGFNAILVNLIEHKYSTQPPQNFYGDAPFLGSVAPFSGPSDYSRPNEAYFAHADRVIELAASKGMLVLLVPSYLGVGGGEEGWYQEMVANDAADSDRLKSYGRYLGTRYGRFDNIMWVAGGDYDPPNKALVRAIALGIKERDQHSLHSAHGATESSALPFWSSESWLQVNTVYTYTDATAKSLEAHTNSMPFFFIEGRYENEGGSTEQLVRLQAYQALLSGATGHLFGNNPIWHFDGPSLFPVVPSDWRMWLESAGAQSMVHLRSLLSARAWWMLVPDISNSLLTNGHAGAGTPRDRAVAAKASDSSFAMIYMPSARAITVNFARMTGLYVNARWYDPANGKFSSVPESPFLSSSGSHVLLPPPGTNSSATGAFTDWVLVLEPAS